MEADTTDSKTFSDDSVEDFHPEMLSENEGILKGANMNDENVVKSDGAALKSNITAHIGDFSQTYGNSCSSVSDDMSESEKFVSGEVDLARQYAEYLENCRNASSEDSNLYEENLVTGEQLNKDLDLSKQYEEYLANREEFSEKADVCNKYEEKLVGSDQLKENSDLTKQYEEYLVNQKVNENLDVADQYKETLVSKEQLNKSLDLSKQYEEYLASRSELSDNSDNSNQYEEKLISREQLNKNLDLTKQYEEYLSSRGNISENSGLSNQYEEKMDDREPVNKILDLSKLYDENSTSQNNFDEESDLSNQDENSQEKFDTTDLSKQYEDYLKSKEQSSKQLGFTKGNHEQGDVIEEQTDESSDLSKQYEDYLKSKQLSTKTSKPSKQTGRKNVNQKQMSKKQAEKYFASSEKFGSSLDLSRQYEDYLASKQNENGTLIANSSDQAEDVAEPEGKCFKAESEDYISIGSSSRKIPVAKRGKPGMQTSPEEKSAFQQYYGKNETSWTDHENETPAHVRDTEIASNTNLAKQYAEYLAKSEKYASPDVYMAGQFKECDTDSRVKQQSSETVKRKFDESEGNESILEDINSQAGGNIRDHFPKRLKFEDSEKDEFDLQSWSKGTSGKPKRLENVIFSLTNKQVNIEPKDVYNAETGRKTESKINENDKPVKKVSRRGRKPTLCRIVQTAAKSAPLLTDAKVRVGGIVNHEGGKDKDLKEMEEGMEGIDKIAKMKREMREFSEAISDMKNVPMSYKLSDPTKLTAFNDALKLETGLNNDAVKQTAALSTDAMKRAADFNTDALKQAAFNSDEIKAAESGMGTHLLTPMEIYSNLLIQMEATGELKETSAETSDKQETPKTNEAGDNTSGSTDKPAGTIEKVKRFACSECNKEYATSSSLRKHMYSHSEEKPHKCKYCNKGFTESSSLKSHEYIHTGEKPLKCHFCDQGFRSPSNLRRHFRVHTGEKPFKCEVCGKEFSQTVRLQSHMLLHTGETPYKCKYCSKGFRTPNQLNSHHRTHTGERPFKCSMCDKTFSDSSNLRTHVRRHIGDKPHECEVCHVLFGFISDLKRHMLTHTKKKPFICPHCNKGFTQSYTLNAHIAIHTGEGLHKCPVCLRNFTTATNLRRHLLKHPQYLDDHPEIAADVYSSTAGGTRNTVMRIYDAASDDNSKPLPTNGIPTPETNQETDMDTPKVVDNVFADSSQLGTESGASENSSLMAPLGEEGVLEGGSLAAELEPRANLGENVMEFQSMINKLLGQQVFSAMAGSQAGNQDLATIAEVLQDASEACAPRYTPGEPTEPELPNLPNC